MKRSLLSALLLYVSLASAPFLSAASFTNGQAARAEFGQFFFNAAQGYPSNQILAGPQGIAYANGTLYVADGNSLGANDGVDANGNPVTGNRIMTFYTSQLPAPNADLTTGPVVNTLCPLCGFGAVNVLGQLDFESYLASSYQASTTVTAPTGLPNQQGHVDPSTGFHISSMWNPSGVASDGQVLAVADTRNNRVLIWNPVPTTLNAPATLVLGQPDFTTLQSASLTNQTTMRGPQGVWIQNGRLFVADTGNNRVMIWNHIPTSNNQGADFILGQPNPSQVVSPNPVSPVAAANTLWSPTSVSSDGVHLFVADLGFNRVLIWNSIPNSPQQPADVVVGQPNFTAAAADNAAGTTYASGGGASPLCPSSGVDQNNNPTYPARCAATLNFPRFVLSDGSRLFIADAGNDRVLIYNQIPTTNGVNADVVLGQPDFASDVAGTEATSIVSTNVDNTGSSDTVGTPTSLAFDGTNLYVADPFNRRVLVFTPGDLQLSPTSVLNAASEARHQEGFVILAGTVVAKDTITVTIDSANYTYTVASGDTLSTITANIITQINSSNSGAGDPNVIALSGSIPDTVYLSSKGVNLGFDTITLSATTSNSADITATTNGSYLTGGNAGTVAPGMIAEINYSLTSPNAPGLADSTVSYDPSSIAPFSETGSLPTTLGGVQVFADGNPLPLFYVSPTQVKAQIPFEYANRSTASLYVRTVHSNGSVTTTTAVPLVIAPANPGLFAASSTSNPRPAYSPQHQTGNPSLSFTVGYTATQAGDIATVTVNGRNYTYTVVSTDTLATITTGIISSIKDPQVTAASTGATGTITLTAVQSGASGAGIPITVATTPASGQSTAQITLTATATSTCCSDNNTGAITALNPAQPNETITVYATGLGLVQDSSSNPVGAITGAPFNGVVPNSAVNSAVATVNNGGGTVVNAGLATGGIGVYAVQIQLPASLTSNAATPLYIAQNAFISNTVTIPVGTPAGTLASLNATPNPIPVASGQLGTTTLSWNTAATTSTQVRVGGPNGALLSVGQGTGSATTGAWVSDGMTFYLQDGNNASPTSSAATLATVTVHLTTTASGGSGGSSGSGSGSTTNAAVFPTYCPAADGNVWLASTNYSFSAQPTTIQVPAGTTFGQTSFQWVLPTSITSVNLYVGLGSVQLLSSGLTGGIVGTGNWVSDGTVFWLQNSTNGNDQTSSNTLGCARVAVTQVSTPVQGRATLAAAPSTIVTSAAYGQTTLNWSCPTCTATQIRVGSPSGSLFAAGSSAGSATTGNWVGNGTTFYLLDMTNSAAPSTVGTVTVNLQAPSASSGGSGGSSSGVITATPNPAFYAPGTPAVSQTTVSWSCSSCSSAEVHVDSPGGPLLATSLGGSGTATTGMWVTDGTVFYLQDSSSGNGSSPSSTVGTVQVAVQQSAPAPPSTSNGGTITADPNPILVSSGVGQTTISWTCGTCTATEVHVNAPNGPLLSSASIGNGTVTTGYWVTYGTVFYLQDATNGNATDPSNTKATVTVWTQPE